MVYNGTYYFFLMDDLGQETSIRGGYTYYMLLTKP